MSDNIIEQYNAIKSAEDIKRKLATEYLDEALNDDGHVFVEKAKMGDTDSFVGVVSFRWIDKNMKLFTEMPMLKHKLDAATGKLLVDEESIGEMQQRSPHLERQYPLTVYLLRQKHRKFPAILAVVTAAWVNNPKAEEWDEDGRAKVTSLVLNKLDSKGKIGLVDLRSGVSLFALDGSHRTLAIRGVMEGMTKGHVYIKNKDGKAVKTKTLTEVLEESNLSELDVEGIEDETIAIEMIPAVLKGETYEEAKRRIRSIFVHVNKTAAPPTAGEQVVLDEDNGYAIITRQVAMSHPLFQKDKPGDRVNWKSLSLPAQSNWILPATTMADMAAALLVSPPYGAWKASKKEIPLRPADDQLVSGADALKAFFDYVALLEPFVGLSRGDMMDDWREFAPKGKGHLLLRPIGLLALADAVGWLHHHPDGPKMDLATIFDKLRKFDKKGGFSDVTEPSSLFYGITYNPVKEKMDMTGTGPAAELLKYLLGGYTGDAEKRSELLEVFRKRRSFGGVGKPRNWDGSEVNNPSDIELPPLLTA